MAEVLGLVASGISVGTLAAQITSSVVKLKSCWDQVRDAPSEVGFLIEQIGDLNRVLAAVEDDLLRNPMSSSIMDSTLFYSCCKSCQKAADRLSKLTDLLSTDLDASSVIERKRGSLNVVLKKDRIANYEKQLQSAMSMLILAYQTYNA